MDPVEFTESWYRSFLHALDGAGYAFRPYTATDEPDTVLLRHDVDLSPTAAVQMARVEAELGITATYFFLLSSPLYNPFDAPTREAIETVESLGHDVGLHFSTHQYWPADEPPAESAIAGRVAEEQASLSAVVERPTSIVSFHLPPDWVLDRHVEGVESTYEPRFFSEVGYRADSNQRWRDEHPLAGALPARLQVLTHPGLWGPEDGTFEERVEAAKREASARVSAYADDRYLDG